MPRYYSHLLIAILLSSSIGCSDDGAPVTPDTVAVDATVDAGGDLAPDQGQDTSTDLPLDDSEVDQSAPQEAGTDSTVDASADGPGSDAIPDLFPSNKSIYGQVRLPHSPGLDGRGTLYVGIYQALVPPPFFPAQDMISIANADLSHPQLTVPYSFTVRPQAGTYLLYAFLDDNDNASNTLFFIVPDAGDTVVSEAIVLEVPAGSSDPIEQDIDLDLVFGGTPPVPDGGVGDGALFGALRGRISASVQPTGDGVGTAWVRLSKQQPPAPWTLLTASAANLASPFGGAHYFIGTVEPGNYYLEVLLDDNANVDPADPVADSGDLIHTRLMPVRIEAGITTELDVVLDAVKE